MLCHLVSALGAVWDKKIHLGCQLEGVRILALAESISGAMWYDKNIIFGLCTQIPGTELLNSWDFLSKRVSFVIGNRSL